MASPTESVDFWQHARKWWRRREWQTFAAGAPALVAAFGVGGVALACWSASDRELQGRYLSEGKAAFEAKDYPHALTCYERVVADRPDPEQVYRLALVAEALGDSGRAAALMRSIARDGGTGYAPAHYWLARKILALPPSPGSHD